MWLSPLKIQPEDPDNVHNSGLSNDISLNPSMQYNFTINYSMGKIYFDALNEKCHHRKF